MDAFLVVKGDADVARQTARDHGIKVSEILPREGNDVRFKQTRMHGSGSIESISRWFSAPVECKPGTVLPWEGFPDGSLLWYRWEGEPSEARMVREAKM